MRLLFALTLLALGACRLTVEVEPGGDVAADSGKIDCNVQGGRCVAFYGSTQPEGDLLRARAGTGHRFVGWSGACSGQETECALGLGANTADALVRAHFQPAEGALVAVTAVPGGVVRSADGRLHCGLRCASSYAAGDIAELIATPLPGFEFTAWQGICAGEGSARCSRTLAVGSSAVAASFTAVGGGAVAGEFINFESGQVRPVALSPDGSRLVVTNTPAASLEIFSLAEGVPQWEASVPVGLEPVAVALPNDAEAWVVNHLSDSVSVVDLAADIPAVTRTLWVGDEPRDIVFAGPGSNRAFISAARRGQNTAYPLQEYRTPGLPRADVWVFDRSTAQFRDHNRPLTVVNLFGDVPRALAASPDGSKVYAGIFHSGNRTTTLSSTEALAAAKPAPLVNHAGEVQPATGLIVRFDQGRWVDESATDWSDLVRLSLPDYDLFTLDAKRAVPRQVGRLRGVGTTLFNMAVNPASGAIYVTNTDARNVVRFEGPGTSASSVRGDIARNRISVVADGLVNPVELNPHVDFSVAQGEAIPLAEKARSLAQPTAIAVSPDGSTVFVAAFGSNKVAAIPAGQLQRDEYVPDRDTQVEIPGGGPSGLVLSNDGERLYVLARYRNEIVVVETQGMSVLHTVSLFNPEPDSVRRGRRFLYDADATSGNGTASCGSCHVFGDTDHLAWDLGNPDEEVVANPLPFALTGQPEPQSRFHPMKGPMTTQTFRGISDSGPMHWRGDRTGSNRVVVNGVRESVEAAAFKEFRGAFVGLLGRPTEIPEDDLQAFTDFALGITPPPNPLRALDNSLTPSQQLGQQIYFDEITTGGNLVCNDCHTLDPARKQFGTGGQVADEGPGITEDFKVPHFRNLYTKVGMFGLSANDFIGEGAHMGPQVRGFGFLHDGSVDTLDHFFSAVQFNLAADDARRGAVVDFVMAADSNLAPIVGQQVTLDASLRYVTAVARLDLMLSRALAGGDRPECDLIVAGVIGGARRSALLREDGFFHLDTDSAQPLSVVEVKRLAKQPGRAFTFTCVPPGSGVRLALDRDGDGVLNFDEA